MYCDLDHELKQLYMQNLFHKMQIISLKQVPLKMTDIIAEIEVDTNKQTNRVV